jgi:hypothetical protein
LRCGDVRRAEIVDVLAPGERPVEEIAEQIGQSVANTGHHRQRLLRAATPHVLGTARSAAVGSASDRW